MPAFLKGVEQILTGLGVDYCAIPEGIKKHVVNDDDTDAIVNKKCLIQRVEVIKYGRSTFFSTFNFYPKFKIKLNICLNLIWTHCTFPWFVACGCALSFSCGHDNRYFIFKNSEPGARSSTKLHSFIKILISSDLSFASFFYFKINATNQNTCTQNSNAKVKRFETQFLKVL